MNCPGNNWGQCPSGGGRLGCGPQEEYRACSDIEISHNPSVKPTTSAPELNRTSTTDRPRRPYRPTRPTSSSRPTRPGRPKGPIPQYSKPSTVGSLQEPAYKLWFDVILNVTKARIEFGFQEKTFSTQVEDYFLLSGTEC